MHLIRQNIIHCYLFMYAVFIFNVYDNMFVTVVNYCIICMQYYLYDIV